MRRQGIPLFDVRHLNEPMRRTAAIRLVLAAALVGTLLFAAWYSRDPGSSAVRVARGGDSGVVVLDMSASIGGARRRLTEPFEYLADTNQDFGLVLFSSVAYETMPPGTAAPELRGFLRALAPYPDICFVRDEDQVCPPGQRRVESGSAEEEEIRRGSVTPWSENFRGGTKISTGLQLAREMLERHDQEERGTLLISDLDNSGLDTPALTRELITYERKGIPLYLVAMSPFDEDRFFFERLVGKEAFVDRADMAPPRLADERRRAERAGVPAGLAGLALLLLMLLAANEHFCGRLAWRSARGQEVDQ